MSTATATQLEWQDLWDAMDAAPEAWIETTEEMFWSMLEAVPPRAQHADRFLVGEAKTHDKEGKAVHACFKEVRGQYFAKHMTIEHFNKGAA